jgi:ribosomal protein L11 methyltransferase
LPTKSSKKWLTVTVTCPEKIVEAVADQIGVMSGVGVEIQPVDSSDKQTITGFFDLGEDVSAGDLDKAAGDTLLEVTRELEKLFAIYNLILHEPETKIINDQDWATSWRQFFSTMEIIPGLVIKPSWEEYTPDANQHVIKMDPGMAFGTGQHASTKLALTLLASCFDTAHSNKPSRILDVGTGTGILAMAAAAYGADQIMAIDNDPEAVTVAEHNVHANHFDWNIGVSTRPLEDLEGPYDLICANIVHDVLVDMTSIIKRLAEHNCHIILSGILNGEQEKNIEHVYRENGMSLVRVEHEEEWTAMLLQKG